MSVKLKVGCCGFPTSMSRYFSEFKLVEIQATFYRIIWDKTLKRWRESAPNDFEFTVKAFQGITHDVNSPTWRKSNIKEYKSLKDKVGYLRPTSEVLSFWSETLKAAKILRSNIILIQLPRSFRDTKENINNASNFFEKITRGDIRISIELRGWSKTSRKALCEEYDLIDVVDPFGDSPAYVGDVLYFRLHGKYTGTKIIYNYRYSTEELKSLKEIVIKYFEEGVKRIYVLFNNSYMYEDAKRFMRYFEND